MKKQDIKKLVREKYTRQSRFCKLVGYTPMQLQRLLNTEEGRAEVLQKINATANAPIPGEDLTDAIRKQVFMAIANKHRNVTGLVTQHPEFSHAWLSRLINAQGGLKTQTAKFKKLCKILNLNINGSKRERVARG